MTNEPSFPSLTDRFAAIIRGLRSDVCQRGNQIRLPGWLVALISAYLNRMIARFAVLVAKDLANPNPNPAPPTPTRIRPARPVPEPAPARLPHQHAWLARLVPPTPTQGNATATGRHNIQTLLSDPELLALIARNPAAGRIFRPLCHMLGIPLPSILRRPKQPRPPRPDPQTPRAPKPRAAPRPSLFPTPPRTPAPWEQHHAFLRLITPRDFQT